MAPMWQRRPNTACMQHLHVRDGVVLPDGENCCVLYTVDVVLHSGVTAASKELFHIRGGLDASRIVQAPWLCADQPVLSGLHFALLMLTQPCPLLFCRSLLRQLQKCKAPPRIYSYLMNVDPTGRVLRSVLEFLSA